MHLGIYEHYKGRKYKVIAIAKHSETLEDMVVYHVLEEDQLWVRPKKMFEENVEIEGRKLPRFKFISSV